MKVQRLRFRYRLTADAGALGHRDIAAAWESAMTAAGLPLAQSEGKRPAPLISLAAPLPMGATSDCEIADVFLECRVDPASALERVGQHLPGRTVQDRRRPSRKSSVMEKRELHSTGK